jgi:hypothetical protein
MHDLNLGPKYPHYGCIAQPPPSSHNWLREVAISHVSVLEPYTLMEELTSCLTVQTSNDFVSCRYVTNRFSPPFISLCLSTKPTNRTHSL